MSALHLQRSKEKIRDIILFLKLTINVNSIILKLVNSQLKTDMHTFNNKKPLCFFKSYKQKIKRTKISI